MAFEKNLNLYFKTTFVLLNVGLYVYRYFVINHSKINLT